MSNIYIQEPPALGKIVLKTTVGDIDIELWTKETPKACRNFIQLCMEGYYNGTIFHRLVPDFIVQGGDPNGDGTGGESIYGSPFKDEFHSRLRFNRRGLVAMANAGKDDNGSQFFFTLNTTPELQNKHTIFGKVTGETIFNMLKLAEGLTDADDRPIYPHKIVSAEILINPFEDIVPRVVPKDSKIDKDAAKEKKKKERVAVKNFGLLSFGDEAEEDEDEAVEYRGKPKSTHDLLNDPKLSKQTAAELNLDDDENENDSASVSKRSEAETQAAVNSIKEKLQAKKSAKDKTAEKPEAEENDESSGEEYYLGKEKADQRRKDTEKIRDEIKQMKKDLKSTKSIDDKGKGDGISNDAKTSKNDNEMYEQYISEQEKYKKLKEAVPKKGPAREPNNGITNRKRLKRKPWVKKLYENRGYPDNYTDTRFLEELQKNLYVEKYTLFQAIVGSLRVTQRLCFCILFAVVFVYMYNEWVDTDIVVLGATVATVIGYTIYLILQKVWSNTAEYVFNMRKMMEDNFKTVIAYLVLGYILSPIVYTLTDTVSTDTIYATTVLMMIVHLLFFDYGVSAAIVSNSLSINAAIFGSICLVSRLSNAFDAFILLTLSLIVFVLSQQLIKVMLGSVSFLIVFSMSLFLTTVALYSISHTLVYFFLISFTFLNICCPILFVRWQKYKDNIYGPWDEAIVYDSDDIIKDVIPSHFKPENHLKSN